MIVKLTIAYDGSKFFGSQIQNTKDTVHGRIKKALETLGIHSKIVFSGRTDKNVHATKQVLSFELPIYWINLKKLRQKLICFVPSSIQIKSLKKVKNDFHARFSAKKRAYRYVVSKNELNAFNNMYMTYFENININLIKQACNEFIGVHNFEYFHKKGSEPTSTIREIYDIKFYLHKDIYVFKFTANSYLRSQIRMMIYAIMEVSSKQLSLEELRLQIQNKKQFTRRLSSANGLYLCGIWY